ncbi:MAG: ion transporter [Verrucomicrobia bacterium]|jgi:hypothetical protein|nr:ion transporter [Verrucomicrobiota bacterium]|tara:strand:+ start:15862 stop:16518 length:657 start_codon:yes stop_codon:yes gene_type:complete
MRIFLKIENKAKILLAAELALILSSLNWDTLGTFWLGFVYPGFFAICACVLAGNKHLLHTYLLLAVIAIVAELLPEHLLLRLIQLSCHIAGFFFLAREIFRHSFFKDGVLPTDRIFAGISGYILLGLFALLISIAITDLQPNAFLNQITGKPPNPTDLLYFSFVTLTTLGYGDIVPATQPAKIFTILTALSGVLYLAIFISSLISRNHEPLRKNKPRR